MDILERDKNWRCIECESLYSKEIIYCKKCQIFRPLEMFKNMVHDPMNVTDFELNFLDQRRKLEKKLILDKDLEALDDEDEESKEDDNPYTKKIWFMISGEWLYQWKCFISNKISNSSSVSNEQKSRVLLSENREIGVQPPGPIKNDCFFTRDPNN